MPVSISVSVKGLDKFAAKLATEAARNRAHIRLATERSVRIVERDLKKRAMTGQRRSDPFWGPSGPPASSNQVAVRSGHTRRSVTGRVYALRDTVIGVVGTALKHVAMLEEGGVVRGSPMLRIPTGAAKTGAGVDREAGRSVKGKGYFIWPNRAQRSGKLSRVKNVWLAKVVGGIMRLFYLLKPQVRHRARWLFRTSLRRTWTQVQAQFKGHAASMSARINRR